MKFRPVLAVAAALTWGQVQAGSYSNLTTVKGLTIEPGTQTVRVILEDSTGGCEPCSSESWYAFSLSDTGGKELYATLLASKGFRRELVSSVDGMHCRIVRNSWFPA
jgi:hypothetical protein